MPVGYGRKDMDTCINWLKSLNFEEPILIWKRTSLSKVIVNEQKELNYP